MNESDLAVYMVRASFISSSVDRLYQQNHQTIVKGHHLYSGKRN